MTQAVETLLAESEIRQLLARYTDAIYRKDMDAVRDCWAGDGVWHAFGQRTAGREEIIGWLTNLTAMFSLIWQTAHGVVLEIDGETATARVHIDEISVDQQDVRRFAMGIYHDRYSKIDGRWVFVERFWDLIYLGGADLSAKLWPVPAFGKPPFAQMDRPNRPTLEELASVLGL